MPQSEVTVMAANKGMPKADFPALGSTKKAEERNGWSSAVGLPAKNLIF